MLVLDSVLVCLSPRVRTGSNTQAHGFKQPSDESSFVMFFCLRMDADRMGCGCWKSCGTGRAVGTGTAVGPCGQEGLWGQDGLWVQEGLWGLEVLRGSKGCGDLKAVGPFDRLSC